MYNSTVRETIFRKSYVYESSIIIKHFPPVCRLFIPGIICYGWVQCLLSIRCGWVLHNPWYNLWMDSA